MTASENLLQVDVDSYESWRLAARGLLTSGAAPATIQWIDRRSQSGSQQQTLKFTSVAVEPQSPQQPASIFRVPKDFLDLSQTVAQHRSPQRWELLYRMLWRITGGERQLLEIASDVDVYQARQMEKAIRRDAHKMKAFVRFRKVGAGEGERYAAWHRPDHYVVPITAGFFARRFDVMRWAILTPDESVFWNGSELEFAPGCPRGSVRSSDKSIGDKANCDQPNSDQPNDDEMEELWKTYYASIFNPARIKLNAMRAEMPKKHWATLPETELIAGLVRQAPKRVDEMVEKNSQQAGAEAFVPSGMCSLERLSNAAAECRGCDLHQAATHVVFGRGPATARLMLVGEQPGDAEDLAGEPFIGPAGRLLEEVLEDVGLKRDEIYITNSVKHFKWKASGKRRLHVKPASREISACRPWLVREIETLKPAMIVCLGATAAGVILGPSFRITKQRGEVVKTEFARWTMATYHPSALLRVPDPDSRAKMRALFTRDLAAASEYLRNLSD